MQILLVEDDDPKRDKILSYLGEHYADSKIEIAKSVKSAIAQLKKQRPSLMLLDISLSTFDMGANESGGRPQGFGGIEVLTYMDFLKVEFPVIVITQYEVFTRDGEQLNHDALRQELRDRFPQTFRGLVYYNSVYDEWKSALTALITETTANEVKVENSSS